MTKHNDFLTTVINAARDRADLLDRLSAEMLSYGNNHAAKELDAEADKIRLACAELDRS